MVDKLNNLIVTGLEVENVKRVRVARIKAGPGLVEISGKNGNGKSSLLDAIAMALGGKDEIPWQPIRNGEEQATIRVDLGNDLGHQLRVTRRLTARDKEGEEPYTTSLRIEDADGKVSRGGQGLLDSLVNGISFDPEEFKSAKPAHQVEILKGLVPDFDFDLNATERKRLFDRRTEVNRDAKRTRAQAEGIDVPVGTPAERINAAGLIEQLRALGDERAEVEKKRAARQQFHDINEQNRRDANEKRRRASELRIEAAELDAQAGAIDEETDKREEGARKWPELVEPGDGANLQQQIADADRINAMVARRESRAILEKDAADLESESTMLTREIERCEKARIDAIAGADLPADGLSIDGDRVMLRGVPFDQASQAEQIKTSLAIGMALNPRLKVMRVKHGNDLDNDAWALIAEVCRAEGIQCWVESINPHSPAAVVMEDGKVRA